jgi:hypothetical protein
VPNFARIAAPLTDLTKAENAPAGTPLPWGLKQQTSFETLKQGLRPAPVLAVPDSQGLLTLQTVASEVGVGAVVVVVVVVGRFRDLHQPLCLP